MANKLYDENAIIGIADAIRAKNGTSTTYKVSEMASAIEGIETGNQRSQWAMLEETESKTFTMKDGTTTNVACTPNIRILDSNFKSWSIEEWHEEAVKNGFDKTKRADPIAFDFLDCCGHHVYWYFKCKGTEVDTVKKTWYDISGTQSTSAGMMPHSWYNYTLVTGELEINDANGTTARAVVYGDDIVLSTTNSPATWRIKKGRGALGLGTFAYIDDNVGYYNAMVAQCEWLRHRAAIDSGLTTTAENGTLGIVTIVTESDGEMYFYINGTKTTKPAKYNIHTFFTANNPTSAQIDILYSKQKTNGTNMNHMCVNNDTKPVVIEGSKGAEAYAFNGKWMIVTPIISRAGTSYTTQYHIADAPAIYYAQYLRTLFGRNDIITPDAKTVLYYFVNRDYAISSYISYLKNSSGELWADNVIPQKHTGTIWAIERYSATSAWYINYAYGYISNTNVYSTYRAVGVSALS